MKKIKSFFLSVLFLTAMISTQSSCTAETENETTEPTHSSETEKTENTTINVKISDGFDLCDGDIVKISNFDNKRALNMDFSGMLENSYVIQYASTGMFDELWRVHVEENGGVRFENLFVPRYFSYRGDNTENAAIDVVSEISENNLWFVKNAEINGENAYVLYSANDGKTALGLHDSDINSDNKPLLVSMDGELKETYFWLLEKTVLPSDLPYMLPLEGKLSDAGCPQIMKYGDVYYCFSMTPGVNIKYSYDMINWENYGRALRVDPAWFGEEIPGYGLWAPSCYYFGGKYYLYYCLSTLGSQNSAIGVAYNETLDHTADNYKWVDLGMVIRSTPKSDYNCIDPNISILDNGEVWLTFGSYWNGIYQMQINPDTGHLMHQDGSEENIVHHVAYRFDNIGAIEAPYIIQKDGYYYMFIAYNQMDLSYQSRVGRSEDFHGPYYDKKGNPLMSGGGTQVTKGLNTIRMPGHTSVFLDTDSTYYMVGEYFREYNNSPAFLFISKIVWDNDGWPVTALTPDTVSRLFD